jgi:hypothetical protein
MSSDIILSETKDLIPSYLKNLRMRKVCDFKFQNQKKSHNHIVQEGDFGIQCLR